MKVLPYLIVMLICVVLSGYFSATETAFLAVNKTRLRTLSEKGNRKANLVLKLSEEYDRMISTILIGNNIVNIALASLGTVLFVHLYGDIGATVSTAVITVVVLVFGEVTPKSIAKDYPECFAMFSAPLLRFLIWLFTPFNFLFSLWKKMLSKVFKPSDDNKMSQEELLMLVEEVEEDGTIDSHEGSLLRNAIEFTDIKVKEILTHRVDLEGVSTEATKEEIAKVFSDTKFSRILVYEDDLDHIVGVLHQKNFYTESGISDCPIEELMSPPIFIPQSTKLSDLLKQLQTSKSHIAVVVDEYGETQGIVTMEDILEELVGDIWDEHDEIVQNITEIEENRYRIGADTQLDELREMFDMEIDSESSTINGWISEQLNKIAEVDDHFEFEKLSVTVVETEAHKASLVEVVVSPEAPDGEEPVEDEKAE